MTAAKMLNGKSAGGIGRGLAAREVSSGSGCESGSRGVLERSEPSQEPPEEDDAADMAEVEAAAAACALPLDIGPGAEAMRRGRKAAITRDET